MTHAHPEAVLRLNLGYIVRPASETETGAPRVKPILGYLVRSERGAGLFDTGIAGGHDDLDAHIAYETIDGQAEIAPGVYLGPTPGHVDGHQSLVAELTDAAVVCAGQSHDTASLFTYDVMALEVQSDEHATVPQPSGWLQTLLTWHPKRVLFAHDLAV